MVECRTPEREVRGSRPTSAVLCPWARHFTPRKYWLITQEAMAPSRHDWKIVDWDVKPQHNQPKQLRNGGDIIFPHYKSMGAFCCHGNKSFDPICPKTLCSLSPTPMMLHIKFDQDWPTCFRDIQVQKCEIFVTQGKVTPKWVVWFSPKLNSTQLVCLSWLPATLMMIRSKMNKLAWRHHFPIISLLQIF